MKVIEAIKKDKPALSFEFFPPKTPEQETRLFKVIEELKVFNPDFVSVTYGAMGNNREKSFFWVEEIKRRFQIEPVAHLTCVAADQKSMKNQLDHLAKAGIENILALRGDPPQDMPDFTPPRDGFLYAKDLIGFIKKNNPSFCVGAAGFPEGHPRSSGKKDDIAFLRQKVDAGAEYIITQLFFDNTHFYKFREACKKAGIDVPIIAGIMPITSYKQIKRLTDVCGATFPAPLREKLEKHQADEKALQEIGIEQAVSQVDDLLKSGLHGFQFFVMNQSESISRILEETNLTSASSFTRRLFW